jgi:hypothetical protein
MDIILQHDLLRRMKLTVVSQRRYAGSRREPRGKS